MTEKPPNPTQDAFDFPQVTKPTGYVIVDHRASPGLTEEQARRLGFHDPKLAGEGKVFEADTLACCHCPSVFIKRPDRIRARGYCPRCNDYICDACEIATKDPNYVHYTRKQMIDLVTNGYDMSGSMSLPIFTKRKESKNG